LSISGFFVRAVALWYNGGMNKYFAATMCGAAASIFVGVETVEMLHSALAREEAAIVRPSWAFNFDHEPFNRMEGPPREYRTAVGSTMIGSYYFPASVTLTSTTML
jgi:hypothetical protein